MFSETLTVHEIDLAHIVQIHTFCVASFCMGKPMQKFQNTSQQLRGAPVDQLTGPSAV